MVVSLVEVAGIIRVDGVTAVGGTEGVTVEDTEDTGMMVQQRL